jgi:alpha-tubulin suppressor-like RCC1 family protein
MINSANLVNKICSTIDAGGLTDLQTCQTTGALNILNSIPVVKVSTRSNLPNANLYQGRLIYVDDENRYYHAIDGVWSNNLKSSVSINRTKLYCSTTTGNNELFSNLQDITDICQISLGIENHNHVLTKSGTIWSWGCNRSVFSNDGKLGDGTTINRSSPVSVLGGFTDWCQVSAGFNHSNAIRTNGTLWSWGGNCSGQLGIAEQFSSVPCRLSPVSVVGGFTDWCQVSAASNHAVALRTNGTLWAWGLGTSGQIGDNNISCRSSPVSVVGGFTDWCQVSTNGGTTLAVRSNGTAWAWGGNGFGQIGDGTTTNRSSPVSVVGGFTDWCQVSMSKTIGSSFGIRRNGTLWAWGCNRYGSLGTNNTINRSSPVSVVGGFTDWCQVSSSGEHTVAVRTNGTAWAWGNGRLGQIANGSFGVANCRSSPVPVVGGFTDWCQVNAQFGAYGTNFTYRTTFGLRNISKGF